MNNISNTTPYLRTSRNFPEDLKQLTVEVNKCYIDIANAVNTRTISLYPSARSAVTGEVWQLGNQRQQTLRQVFIFTSFANIPHPINFDQNPYISNMYGQYYDGTNWYGLIPGTNVAGGIAGQVVFYLTPIIPGTPPTPGNIVFIVGAGAPALVKGIIVLEWMAQP